MKKMTINKKYALLSVYNKQGIVDFAKQIIDLGYEIISTEGTGRELTKNNIPFIPARRVSRNPNYLTDCIQTISYRIEGSIVFDRSNRAHLEEIRKLNMKNIELVVCNFPPLKNILKISDFNIGNIDLGGPLMVRAAAINFRYVIPIVDTKDYKKIIKIIAKRNIAKELRKEFAIKAFKYTRNYDSRVVKYLRGQLNKK